MTDDEAAAAAAALVGARRIPGHGLLVSREHLYVRDSGEPNPNPNGDGTRVEHGRVSGPGSWDSRPLARRPGAE